MSAPKGNEFWKIRTKHGRDKIFSEPDVLLQSAYEYFRWNANNPWQKAEAIKSGEFAGTIMHIPTERPLTIEGLTQFLGVNRKYFDDFEKTCSQDFSAIITHIREIISRQKIEGAMVGSFNPTIVSRIEGLVDKSEVKNENLNFNVEPSPEEAKKIKESFDKEF